MSGPGDTTEDLPGGWEAAAAEYVLGLLPADERAAFEARLAEDPDLEQDVAAWSEYFSTLADTVPEAAPPPQMAHRIEAQLFPSPLRSFWTQLLPYAAGAVAGAAVTWAVFTMGLLTPSAPEYRASLSAVEGGDLALTARFDADSRLLALDRVAGPVPADRALELWLIGENGATPVSLGLLDGQGNLIRQLPPILADRLPGAMLAVSEEPPGGSPTGAPTGPVRAAGLVDDA